MEPVIFTYCVIIEATHELSKAIDQGPVNLYVILENNAELKFSSIDAHIIKDKKLLAILYESEICPPWIKPS